MPVMNGNSTAIPKIEVESKLYYNYDLIGDVGTFDVSAAGSGTFTQGVDYAAVGTTPDDAVVRAKCNINSTTDIGITITGTDNTSASMTWTATIKARAPEGQSYELVPATAGRKLKTIVSIAISGGVLGDGFDIATLPDPTNDVWMQFDHGIEFSFGSEIMPVYTKYELYGNKRTRGDHKVSINNDYQNNYTGLAAIRNREVTLIQRINDNGRTSVTEVTYASKVMLGNSVNWPSDDKGFANNKAEGYFGRLFIFS